MPHGQHPVPHTKKIEQLFAVWGGSRLSETPWHKVSIQSCAISSKSSPLTESNTVADPVLGSAPREREIARPTSMCLRRVVILIMKSNQVTTVGMSPNGRGALTTTVCSAYQADTITVFRNLPSQTKLSGSQVLRQPSALARTFKCSGKQSALACAPANKVLWHAQVCSGCHNVRLSESCQINHRSASDLLCLN